jgi:hypothetical protein
MRPTDPDPNAGLLPESPQSSQPRTSSIKLTFASEKRLQAQRVFSSRLSIRQCSPELLAELAPELPFDLQAARELLAANKGDKNAARHHAKTAWPDESDSTIELWINQAELRALKESKSKAKPAVADPDEWESAFCSVPTPQEREVKLDLLIEHLHVYKTINVTAAPIESYKTMAELAKCHALLTGEHCFEHFEVKRTVTGITYLVPEMGQDLLILYARKFGLDRMKQFKYRTMAQGPILPVDHPWMVRAAEAGNFLVFDTMNYFTGATDDNDPLEINAFAQKLRQLIDMTKCPGVDLLAHPTKTGARNVSSLDITEFIAGTYAKAGFIDSAFALKRRSSDVWVQRIKSRPFLGVECLPFTLTTVGEDGSDCLKDGRFPILKKPGEAGEFSDGLPLRSKGGRPSSCSAAKLKEIRELQEQGKSQRQIADLLNESQSTISRWVAAVEKEEQWLNPIVKS